MEPVLICKKCKTNTAKIQVFYDNYISCYNLETRCEEYKTQVSSETQEKLCLDCLLKQYNILLEKI